MSGYQKPSGGRESLLVADSKSPCSSFMCQSFVRCSLRCISYPNSGWKTKPPTSATISNVSPSCVNPLAPLGEKDTSSKPASPSHKPWRVNTHPAPSPQLQITGLRAFLHLRLFTNTLKLFFRATTAKRPALNILWWLKDQWICKVVTLRTYGIKREVWDPNALFSEKPSMGPNELEKSGSL